MIDTLPESCAVEQLKPGDLIFYEGLYTNRKVRFFFFLFKFIYN